MKIARRRSNCPIAFALDIWGDKWSLLIIRDIMFLNKNSYGDFLKSDEKISTNILADRLSMLECAGLLKCEADLKNKTKKVYKLTQKSIDLLPALIEIVKWSSTYDKDTGAPQEFIKRISTDKENFINEMTMYLKSVHLS